MAAPPRADAAPLTLDLTRGSYQVDIKDAVSLSLVGDVNGDGVPDTASAGSDPSGSCAPLAIAFRRRPDLSAAGGFEITDSADGCPGQPPVVFPAGDVNGDGVGDLAVQTRRRGTQEPGRLYVVFGQPGSGPVDLAQLGSRGFAIEDSSQLYGSPGKPLQVAHGDVNGDGRDDLLIHDGSSSATRPPQVVFGKPTSDTVNLHDLGADGFAAAPPPSRESSDVESVAIVPDMNGDKRAEIAFALGGPDATSARDWGTFVLFGRTSSETATAGSAPGFRIDRGGTVIAAGDVNGDGAGDLVVDSFVVFGKPDAGTVLTRPKDFGGFEVTGEEDACPNLSEDEAPLYLAPAGDVNGDGLSDVILECGIVFGKRGHDPVSLASPSAGGFVVKQFGEGVFGLIGLGDVTGDGRGDLVGVGEFSGPATLIRSPALVSAPVPVRLASAGATAPVLCLARAGCVGEVTMRALARASCNGVGVAKDELVGRGGFQLAADEFGAVRIGVSDRVRRLSRCLLGLSVVERASLDSAESTWTRELESELVPAPVPAGQPWTTLSQPVSGGAVLGKDLDLTFDGSGNPYALVSTGRLRGLRTWLVRPGARPRPLGLTAASIAPFDARRLLTAGVRRERRHYTARYALAQGAVSRTRALDPGHTTLEPTYYPDEVVIAANRRGLAIAAVDRRISRYGVNLVARFIGRAGPRRAQVVHRGVPDTIDAAIDSRGDAIIAWCEDPDPGFVIARRGGRFGKVHSLGPNEEGSCGDLDVAIGPGGRYTIIWRTQVTPYNPPDGPVETRLTTGTIGKGARSSTLDEIEGAWAGADADRVAAVYSGTNPVVGWTGFDAVTEHSRAMAVDLVTHTVRWLSPPDMDAVLGGMTGSRGALAAVWGPISGIEFTAAVYASYAPHGLGFGAPERIMAAGDRHHIDGVPQIAFAPGSRRPFVAALDAARAARRFVFARRPR